MAIKPGYRTFTFDGQSSGAYKTYITGSAVYNAPEREVEMIEIPGRSGAFALDKGRFENIEVTYPAGIYANSQEEFAEALSDLRNMLCSRTGYCRLEDEYNPDEYRMAVYKSGLDVDPAAFQRAGEFEITFECKPQRWLKSGEAKQTIANSGDTITNPTLFETSPLLEVEGYGEIGVNDSLITIISRTIGTIPLFDISKETIPGVDNQTYTREYTFNNSLLNVGDSISIGALIVLLNMYVVPPWRYYVTSIQSESGTSFDYYTYVGIPHTGTYDLSIGYKFNNMSFSNGTSKTYARTTNFKIDYYDANNQHQYEYAEITVTLSYDGSDKFTLTIVVPTIPAHSRNATLGINASYGSTPTVYGESTKSALGNPLYIDLEIGEAYKIESGSVISINDAVQLPAELPTLAPGSNAITYDNTITDLKVTPRWWKV